METYGSPVAWETAGRPGDAERFSEGLLSPCVWGVGAGGVVSIRIRALS